MCTVASDIAAEEKAEPFDPFSWLDIGYSHTRRAVLCKLMLLHYGEYVRDSHIPRFPFGKDD